MTASKDKRQMSGGGTYCSICKSELCKDLSHSKGKAEKSEYVKGRAKDVKSGIPSSSTASQEPTPSSFEKYLRDGCRHYLNLSQLDYIIHLKDKYCLDKSIVERDYIKNEDINPAIRKAMLLGKKTVEQTLNKPIELVEYIVRGLEQGIIKKIQEEGIREEKQKVRNFLDETNMVLLKACLEISDYEGTDTERLEELIREIRSIVKTGKQETKRLGL